MSGCKGVLGSTAPHLRPTQLHVPEALDITVAVRALLAQAHCAWCGIIGIFVDPDFEVEWKEGGGKGKNISEKSHIFFQRNLALYCTWVFQVDRFNGI